MTITEALDTLVRAGRIKSAWLPGMRDEFGRRVVESMATPIWLCDGVGPWGAVYTSHDAYAPPEEPDTSDPLTVMGLLLLAREAYRDGTLAPRCRKRLVAGLPGGCWTDGPWDVVSTSEHVTIGLHGTLADTEADAIIAALVAAAREVAGG